MLQKLVSAAFVFSLLLVGTSHAAELEIGAKGPDFKAKGVDKKDYTLANAKEAKVVVLCFTCNRCPVSVAYEDRFIAFTKAYKKKGVEFVAINCNNRTENLEKMAQRAEEKGFNFPYAFDESGEAAGAYGARVTPHIFVLDKNRKLAYKGAFDDSMKNPKKNYVADAVTALLAGETPKVTTTKAVGCGIARKKK